MSAAGIRMCAFRIRAYIAGIALLAFGVGLHAGLHATNGGNHLTTGAAAALIVIAGLLAARTLAGSAILIIGGRPVGAPAYARTRRPDVVRQCDPDAPGRARPRAPSFAPLR